VAGSAICRLQGLGWPQTTPRAYPRVNRAPRGLKNGTPQLTHLNYLNTNKKCPTQREPSRAWELWQTRQP
jgi:hypothetical protein